MSNKKINEIYSQLANIVNETYSKMADKILVKTDNHIVVFNKYAIKKTPRGYTVANRTRYQEAEFSSARTAFVWVILDNGDRFRDSDRVIELDSKISSIDVELELHRKSKNTDTLEKYMILSSKIQHATERRAKLQAELNRYIANAKRISATEFNLR